MAASRNFVRELIVSAGTGGIGNIIVGGPVNKLFNKTFAEAGVEIGETVTCVIIDEGEESYELGQYTKIAATEFERTKFLEQRKRGLQIPEPRTPLKLSEAAHIYLTVTADEIQEAILASKTIAATEADAAAAAAAAAAASLINVQDDEVASKLNLTTIENDAAAAAVLLTASEATAASITAQEAAINAAIGGEFGEIAVQLKVSTSIVAVLLPDTRHDTDGGLSRDKDGGTSWYNESLNTATRGSTRKRPQAPPIIVEANAITAHDAGDPSVPMWSVFNGTSSNMVRATCTSVAFQDGTLLVGDSVFGVELVDFAADTASLWDHVNQYAYKGNVAQRNDGANWAINVTGGGLVNTVINDVALTVLPWAEPDKARGGLPYLTTAAATDGGVSILNPTGTEADKDKVVDITFTSNSNCGSVTFVDGDKIQLGQRSGGTGDIYMYILTIPTADIVLASSVDCIVQGTGGASGSVLRLPIGSKLIKKAEGNAIATGGGLFITDIDYSNLPAALGKALFAHITTTYPTGLMIGDNSGCWLADTVAGTVSGVVMALNGSFDTDLTGWTVNMGGSIGGSIGVVAGELAISQGSNSVWMGVWQTLDVTGIDYLMLTLERKTGAGGVRLGLNNVAGFSAVPARGYVEMAGAGILTKTFDVSDVTSVTMIIGEGSGAGLSSTMDSASADAAIMDRGPKGNHAAIIGTLTKSEVAAGAQLMGWSTFSSGSYGRIVSDPFTSVATGDFCVRVWFKKDVLSRAYMFSRYSASNVVHFRMNDTTGGLNGFIGSGTGISSAVNLADSQWHSGVLLRRAGLLEMHIDGEQAATPVANSFDITDADAAAFIGINGDISRPFSNGSLSLLSLSASAPTAAQISRMYQFERRWFEPGAQITLGGSSNQIIDIAYCWDTNRVFVATADGCSVFDINTGLRLMHIDATTHPDLISSNIISVSASGGAYMIASDQAVIYFEPAFPLRERRL